MTKTFVFSVFKFILSVIVLMSYGTHAQDIVVTNIAGNGTSTFTPDNLALETGFSVPSGMAIDGEENVYFFCTSEADPAKGGIYKIHNETQKIEKILTDIAGITGLAIDDLGNIYFSRGNGFGVLPEQQEYIYYINDSTGLIDTLAGTGFDGMPVSGINARSTPIGNAGGLRIDPSGKFLYYSGVLFATNFIQKIDLETKVTTRVAGVGGTDPGVDVPDGTPALDAELSLAIGLAWDSKGNLYFGTANYRIKMIKASNNKIYHLLGTGVAGYNGTDIPAATAQLNSEFFGMTIRNDEMFFCDTDNNRLRKISLLPDDEVPMISDYSGTGAEEGDGTNPDGDLVNGQFKLASETNVTPADVQQKGGNLVFSDMGLNRIRSISVCEDANITSTAVSRLNICKGDEVMLSFVGDLGGGAAWNWYEGSCDIGGTALGSGFSLMVMADQSTSYFVGAIGGCLVDETCVEIKLDVICKEYFNTFSPNGDGKNEFLEIPVLENFTSNMVVIYNRWGQVMMTITDYDNLTNVWNGSYSSDGTGDIVDSGTYYFTAESNGELISSGWVQVIK